jgi:hypothetical protein
MDMAEAMPMNAVTGVDADMGAVIGNNVAKIKSN